MQSPTPDRGVRTGRLAIERGWCRVSFAYDIAFAIELAEAQRLLRDASRQSEPLRTRPGKEHFEFHPAPVRAPLRRPPVEVGGRRSTGEIECTLWDFGGAVVTYVFPIEGPVDELAKFGDALHDDKRLPEDARRIAEELLRAIGPAASQGRVAEVVEDYCVYVVEAWAGGISPGVEGAIALDGAGLARLLRAESGMLSDQETRDALSCVVSYAPDDGAVIDWNGSIIADPSPGDVLAVLEFANVELLEMRALDERLDEALDQAHQASHRKAKRFSLFGRADAAEARRIARMQVEGALLFEGVNNAIKLVGDQHLARVYRMASNRLHLAEWDASILRKLETLESIYQKLSDHRVSQRAETLEWIIIALIAFEVVMSLVDRV